MIVPANCSRLSSSTSIVKFSEVGGDGAIFAECPSGTSGAWPHRLPSARRSWHSVYAITAPKTPQVWDHGGFMPQFRHRRTISTPLTCQHAFSMIVAAMTPRTTRKDAAKLPQATGCRGGQRVESTSLPRRNGSRSALDAVAQCTGSLVAENDPVLTIGEPLTFDQPMVGVELLFRRHRFDVGLAAPDFQFDRLPDA